MKMFVDGVEQAPGVEASSFTVLSSIQELTRDMRDLYREFLIELQKLRIHSEIITGENIKEEDI